MIPNKSGQRNTSSSHQFLAWEPPPKSTNQSSTATSFYSLTVPTPPENLPDNPWADNSLTSVASTTADPSFVFYKSHGKDKPKDKPQTRGESDSRRSSSCCTCTNPCFCVKSPETGVQFVIIYQFIMSGMLIVFGLWCAISPLSVGTLFTSKRDGYRAKNIELQSTIRNLGWIYVVFSIVSSFLAFILWKGLKLRRKGLCNLWSWSKILSIVLFLLAFISLGFGSFPQLTGGVVVIFLVISGVVILLDLYSLYVVSLYTSILRLVDQTWAIYKGLGGGKDVQEDEIDENGNELDGESHSGLRTNVVQVEAKESRSSNKSKLKNKVQQWPTSSSEPNFVLSRKGFY